MKEGFKTEGIRRREDYKTLGAKMVVKMEQGFKNEQNARQLVQSETAHGFKNEENARQPVQNEIAAMKEEIKNLNVGSGSTVCSDADAWVALGSGTFARPPPPSTRWTEMWFPRQMEFKGLITDFTQRNIQGSTDRETKTWMTLRK